jgi:hypothetical protein
LTFLEVDRQNVLLATRFSQYVQIRFAQKASLMIRVQCPSCGRESELSDFLKGLTVVCKTCGHGIRVPTSQNNAQPGGAASAPTPAVADPPVSNTPPHLVNAESKPRRSVDRITPPETPVDTPPHQQQMDSAVEYAKAALRMGLTVPEIEQRLVDRGMGPAVASATFTMILGERVHEESESLEREERRQRLHVVLSVATACVCLVLAFLYGGGLSAAKTLLRMLLPLACIWFPGVISRSADRVAVPFIRGGAWFLLLAILGYRVVLLLMVL